MYRFIYSEFWKDSVVIEELTPEDKLYFLYLLTNPCTTNCGIYQITKKQMAFELGYSIETINSLMDRFIQKGFIRYNPDTRELAIKNWGKYNLNKGGKPVIDSLTAELAKVKDKELIQYVGENIKDTCVSIKRMYLLIAKGAKISNYVSYLEIERNDQSQRTIQYNTDTIQYSTDTVQYNTSTNTIQDADTKNLASCSSQTNILKSYEELGFGLVNRGIMEFLEVDVEMYGEHWVIAAMKEAAKQNKFNLKYVEGILRNWKANGRNDNSGAREDISDNSSDNKIYKGYDFTELYKGTNTGEDIDTENIDF